MTKEFRVAENINRTVRRFLLAQRVGNKEAVDFNKTIKLVENFALGELSKAGEINSFTQAKQIIAKTKKFAKAKLEKADDSLLDDLIDLGKMEVAFEKESLDKSISNAGSGRKTKRLNNEQTARSFLNKSVDGLFVNQILSRYNQQFNDKLGAEILSGYQNGLTVTQILNTIKGSSRLNFNDGFTARQENNARTMIRTLTNHVSNSTRQDFFELNNDIVSAVSFVAVLDSRTTLECASNDGKVFDINSNYPTPPLHFNCRSTLVAVLNPEFSVDLSEFGLTRGSDGSDGKEPVDARLNFNEWIGQQSNEFQDEYFGKTKAKLFRDGGLDVSDFVKKDGEVYTLDELDKLHPLAFEKAS